MLSYPEVCSNRNVTPTVCYIDGSLIANLDSGSVRVYFTTAFKVLGFLVAFIGSFAIKRLNQRQAIKNESIVIPVHKLAPWMSAVAVSIYSWRAWRLPGGYWGLLMLFMGGFSLITEYFVNLYINRVDFAGTCGFTRGIAINLNNDHQYTGPVADWEASSVALGVQAIHYANRMTLFYQSEMAKPSLERVILSKATDDQSYYGRDEDILGSWNCSRLINLKPKGDGLTFNNSMGQPSLDKQMIDRGILFDTNQNGHLPVTWKNYIEGDYSFFSGLLAWSLAPNNVTTIRFGMASGIDYTRLTNFNITPVECKMLPSKVNVSLATLNSIWNKMGPAAVLKDTYGQAMVGNLYSYTKDDAVLRGPPLLERYLNAMIMAAGSSALMRTNKEFPGTLVGCVLPRTKIDMRIWVLVGIGITIFLALLLLDLIVVVLGRFSSKWKSVKGMPSDLLDWEVAFLNERRGLDASELVAADLKHWGYGWDDERKLCFQRIDKHGRVSNEATKPLMSTTSNTKPPSVTTNDVEMEHLRPAYLTPQASFSTEYRGRGSSLTLSALD